MNIKVIKLGVFNSSSSVSAEIFANVLMHFQYKREMEVFSTVLGGPKTLLAPG